MSRKNKALASVLLCLALAYGLDGCSASVTSNEEQHLAMAPDDGQEEVLEEDDDGFGRPEQAGAEGKAAGIVMSLTYLAATIGSAVLPFLMLM
jgi:hypothetical protein